MRLGKPRDWVHVISSYRGQWMPGDIRGFRSRGRRVQSSGHPKEHAQLRRHALSISKGEVILAPRLCERVRDRMVEKFEAMSVDVAVIAVGATHCHVLFRAGHDDAKAIMGRAKQAGSRAVTAELPGALWGRSSGVVRMSDAEQFRSALTYIHAHGADGASVWVNEVIVGRLGAEGALEAESTVVARRRRARREL